MTKKDGGQEEVGRTAREGSSSKKEERGFAGSKILRKHACEEEEARVAS